MKVWDTFEHERANNRSSARRGTHWWSLFTSRCHRRDLADFAKRAVTFQFLACPLVHKGRKRKASLFRVFSRSRCFTTRGEAVLPAAHPPPSASISQGARAFLDRVVFKFCSNLRASQTYELCETPSCKQSYPSQPADCLVGWYPGYISVLIPKKAPLLKVCLRISLWTSLL